MSKKEMIELFRYILAIEPGATEFFIGISEYDAYVSIQIGDVKTTYSIAREVLNKAPVTYGED